MLDLKLTKASPGAFPIDTCRCKLKMLTKLDTQILMISYFSVLQWFGALKQCAKCQNANKTGILVSKMCYGSQVTPALSCSAKYVMNISIPLETLSKSTIDVGIWVVDIGFTSYTLLSMKCAHDFAVAFYIYLSMRLISTNSVWEISTVHMHRDPRLCQGDKSPSIRFYLNKSHDNFLFTFRYTCRKTHKRRLVTNLGDPSVVILGSNSLLHILYTFTK